MKELKIVNLIHIGEEIYNLDEMPEERRKEIGRMLNEQALKSIGYRKREKGETA